MSKSIVVALALIAAGTSGAFAADLAAPKSAKFAAPAKSQSWTGCYIGGNVGGVMSSTKVTDEVDGYFIADLNSNAVAGGGQIGCDYQLSGNSPWVIGIQGMYDATKLAATTALPADLAPAEGAVLNGEIPWLATLTARVGYAVSPSLLMYGKAGGAWIHTNSSISIPVVGTIGSTSFGQNGWTAGIGAEFKAAEQISIFAEYNYLALNDTVPTLSSNDLGNVHQELQMVLVGVNFRLNGL